MARDPIIGEIDPKKVLDLVKGLSTAELQELYFEIGIMISRRTSKSKSQDTIQT